MLIVFSFCHRDADLALKQAQWIRELGGVSHHNVMLACNQEARRREQEKPILDIYQRCFNTVELFTPWDEEETPSTGHLKHARPANHLWVRVVQRILNSRKDVPFLWMETDATPTRSEWADRIDEQFQACKHPFLGDHVIVKDTPPHMSGIGVYHETWRHIPEFACISEVAWDVALGAKMLALYYRTFLIQHEWKPASFKTAKDLERIRPEALIYHQCKDGSLIDRLREARGGVEVARPSSSVAGAGSSPAPATDERLANALKEIERLKAEREKPVRVVPTIKRRGKKMSEATKQKLRDAHARRKAQMT